MKALGYYAVVTGKGKQSVVIFITLPHTCTLHFLSKVLLVWIKND